MKEGGNRIFAREMGTFGCWWRVSDAVVVPTNCLPVNAHQTHRVLRQEKVSPNAKNPCVYGTSVNIG